MGLTDRDSYFYTVYKYHTNHATLEEGLYVKGQLRSGVRYVRGQNIQTGEFDHHSNLIRGRYEIDNDPSVRWLAFEGCLHPENGYRDEGCAWYPDGSRYYGQFKQMDRHGVGVMTDAQGAVVQGGRWRRDHLVEPF